VADSIGEAYLGDFARHQLEAARSDPRVDRSRGAMVADFFAAMEEAERWREMTTWGLHELAEAVEQEERRLRVCRDDSDLTPEQRRSLQAAWERSEMARAEIGNEYPYVHAMTLVSMHSALDALVEELVPGAQQIMALSIFESLQGRLSEEQQALWDEIPEERRHLLREAITEVIARQLPQKPKKPTGSGAERYEAVLARTNLQTSPDRSIPDDLDQALSELSALRDVLVHRAGRVDAKALLEAPTLPYVDGEFVRLRRDDYRRYSAAVRAYGIDVTQRIIPPDARRDLADWRNSAYVTA
jgi:hypothetical protein